MRILGISAHYHDSAAVLVDGGKLLAAAQEERFSRVKHDARFPRNAIAFCLSRHPGPLDAVVYYEKPLLKFERILRTALQVAPFGFRAFATAVPEWVKRKLWIPMEIEDELRKLGHEVRGKVRFASHHESHAASAYYPSPFAESAFLTLDGVGEWATTTFGRGVNGALEFLGEIRFPHSAGLLYSAFTYHCGFRVNSGEYKLMGLAPYGKPVYRDLILREIVQLKEDGSFRLNLDYFGFLRGEAMTSKKFETLFGFARRKPEEPLRACDCDLARSIQEVTEELVVRMARHVRSVTGSKNLCLAGGVALNCVANGRLMRERIFENIWVQPAAGDAGGALGAALAYGYAEGGWTRQAAGTRDQMEGAFLGPDYGEEEVEASLSAAGVPFERLDDSVRDAYVAKRIAEGAVVGFFQGKAEYGPRALGARSILADPRSVAMQRVLNLKIKFRESFRPFAPVVLAERASEYFDFAGKSPYMLITAPVKQSLRLAPVSVEGDLARQVAAARSTVPAITHVDYSARIQTLEATDHPQLHALLAAFDRLTGCPLLINTSFNVRGEPPVCHPSEAIEGFLETEMDVLAIGPFIVERSKVPAERLARVERRRFAPD